MRRKLMSLALGVGLTVGAAGTAFADMPEQAVADFDRYTSENWSILGYASVGEARQVLGGDWYAQATGGAGGGTLQSDPMIGELAQKNNQVEQNGTAFDGGFGAGGLLHDDESNGSWITGNDAQGGDDD